MGLLLINKQQVTSALISTHKAFWAEAQDLSDETFHRSINGKWSAAQNIEHINKGLKPAIRYFSLPKQEIETRFGLSNHPSGSSEQIITSYAAVLAKGVKAPERMVPGNAEESWEVLTEAGNTAIETLIAQLENWSEDELEKYNCPHLLLGNITPREMLYFIISHARHHHKAIVKLKQAI